MTTRLSYALRIPAVDGPDLGDLQRFVLRAEELGFAGIWAGDHVFHHTDVLQPFDLLAWIAGQTSRIRLGTAVTLAAYAHPVLLARSAATVDYLSGGRFTLGVSLGGTADEFESLGVPPSQKLGRLLENVAIMRRLWLEDGVDYEGRYHRLRNASVRPKPRHGRLSVYFAGRSEAMLRRLPRVADGWIASSRYSLADFVAGVRTVRQACERHGLAPDAFPIAKVQDVSVHPDRDEARRRAQRHWHRYYGPDYDVEKLVTYGTPEDCTRLLAAFADTEAPAVTLILEPSSLEIEELEGLAQATVQLQTAQRDGR